LFSIVPRQSVAQNGDEIAKFVSWLSEHRAIHFALSALRPQPKSLLKIPVGK